MQIFLFSKFSIFNYQQISNNRKLVRICVRNYCNISSNLNKPVESGKNTKNENGFSKFHVISTKPDALCELKCDIINSVHVQWCTWRGACGADAPCFECLVPLFRMLSVLFCPLFYFKIITLLKVFYNFTIFLHNFI